LSAYRLVFKGQLLEDVDRGACMRELAKMFGEDERKLEQRLFGARRVVVRKTDDERTAQRLVRAFRSAGAVLIVETTGSDRVLARANLADRPIDTTRTRERPAVRVPGEDDEASAGDAGAADGKITDRRDAVPPTGRRGPRRRRRSRRG